jgi:choline dehydrogenase-like flavoprotein
MDYDYIIVGAGAAGCVLAYRLSENPANRILLLQYGGRDVNPMHYVPRGFYFTLSTRTRTKRSRSSPMVRAKAGHAARCSAAPRPLTE